MLVLSRKLNESIVITADGERITVQVVEIRGEKIRLGITASQHVAVHRAEVQQVIDDGSPDFKAKQLAAGNHRRA